MSMTPKWQKRRHDNNITSYTWENFVLCTDAALMRALAVCMGQENMKGSKVCCGNSKSLKANEIIAILKNFITRDTPTTR